MLKKLSPLLLAASMMTISMTCAADQAMIVLDGSGSMQGQIDGKAKITIAKETLNKVVNDWDESIDFGLMAYGHNRKGDCNDIEVLIPLSKIDKDAVLEEVKAIKPKGKTPISDSLQQAAKKLHFTEDKATVILISDGKETCDADPCATAKELEEQGIDFTAHVIGFNVDTNTDKQLACIANATGGEYFSAKNADDLNSAMKKAVKKVEKKAPVKKAPMKKNTAKVKAKGKKYKYNLIISASEVEGGDNIEADHEIFRSSDEGATSSIEACSSFKTGSNPLYCKENIPAGDYIIKTTVSGVPISDGTPVTIKEGEREKVNVITGVMGKLELFATRDGKRVRANFDIGYKGERVGSCSQYSTGKCLFKIFPANTYQVNAKYYYKTDGETLKSEKDFEVTVKPNEFTSLEVEFEIE